MGFFGNLNFTSANEDSRSELAAIGTQRGTIVTLTGSGARALDLLLGAADQVLALDMNPAQNALLGLKMAAFDVLDHDALLAFLGVTASDDRAATYQALRPALTPDDRAFWDARQKILARGVIYAGLWEKVLRFGARATRLWRGQARIDALFAAPDVDVQAALWRQYFDDRAWRLAIRALGQRWVWTRLVGEPGGAFLPPPRVVEARLAGAFTGAAGRFLWRESDFASLILRGTIAPPAALPLHLLPENHDGIRAGLARIRRIDGGLLDLPRLGVQGVTGFSLSDFGSYCDAATYAQVWQAVLQVAAPDARFCERIFMNDLQLPDPRIVLDRALSDRLTAQDRAIIYTLRAGRLAV
ncbi:S-adenosylmethionine-diacylglycerol 3-amino-3-carboxypropyl transferase [Ketogulonicigenium robustum]|uniref:S-adenosylmethionine-diacylglycerol 3-amino-3-carboxypropyl transferase n=1 Tax=Ketogulonicigenium robustum TaxID=92947 RepID=A0A1W6NW10_9RHOB|nr:DUF3419 family protein [Ketogulonicigenium robustum]ARO13422.1 S-adenosylmethionine-diacylglycerol 3-amino-3-carboxypropyl transferase [Ketogulonicigenium robustum]